MKLQIIALGSEKEDNYEKSFKDGFILHVAKSERQNIRALGGPCILFSPSQFQ